METTQIKAPPLRFPDFKEFWKKEPLKNLTKINQGLQIPISERLKEKVENSYFYITNEFLKEGSKKQYYIIDPPKSVLCNESDILMTRTGNTGMVVTNVSGAFHNNFFKIKYSDKLDKEFLFYFLNLYKTQNLILRLAGISTIPDLNHSDFYRIEIPFPQKREQQKIATFLSSVDKKLEQLQKKKELLEQYKKGMMQKIFKQEVRFKDENGNYFPNWHLMKIDEFFTIKAGGDIEKAHVSKEKKKDFQYPIFANSERKKGLYGYSDIYKIDYPCITVTGRGALGVAVARTEKFYPIVRLLVLKPRMKANVHFFEYSLNQLNIYNESTGVPQLTAPQLKTYKISIPDLNEQTKIADFLSAIDDKVDLVATEIEKVSQFKKGLLQQMFI